MKLFIIFSFTCLLSITAFAAEEAVIDPLHEKQVFETAHIFGQCSGFWEAVSHTAEKLDAPETSVELGNRANGWRMAGAYLLYSTGVIESWKAANSYETKIVDSATQTFKSQLELGDQEKSRLFYIENCEPWVDYQLELVTQMRKLIAKHEN